MAKMEERGGEGMETPMGMREEAVAIAKERVVGVALSGREVSAGSWPGGGSIRRSRCFLAEDASDPVSR